MYKILILVEIIFLFHIFGAHVMVLYWVYNIYYVIVLDWRLCVVQILAQTMCHFFAPLAFIYLCVM